MSTLIAENLAKSYKGRQVVKDVCLSIESGQVVGLLGPNGAGKTTCFYMIVGLVRADHGRISIDGQDISHIAMHGHMADVLAVDTDAAMIGTYQADNHVETGGLASSVGAEQTHHLATLNA